MRDAIRIQDHIRIFHEGCGGIVVGELNPTSTDQSGLVCAECGKQMTAMISSEDKLA